MTLKDHIEIADKCVEFRRQITAIRDALKDPDADREALLKQVDALEAEVDSLAARLKP